MKGFFFTLFIFILLSFILISIGLWLTSERIEEEKKPILLQGSVIAQLLRPISKENFEELNSMIGYRAVYYLNKYVRDNGVYSKNITNDILSIMWDGRLANRTKTDMKVEDTLSYWAERMKKLCKSVGFNFNMEIKNETFRVFHIDPWNLNIMYNISFNVRNKEMEVNREYAINITVSLLGFEDPFIYVESGKEGQSAVRQIFFHNHTEFVRLITSGKRGKGWVYGNATNNTNQNASIYIHYGNPDEMFDEEGKLKPEYKTYKGFIIIQEPKIKNQTFICTNGENTCEYILYWEEECVDCLEWTTGCGIGSVVCQENYTRVYKNEIEQAFIAGVSLE